VSDYYHAINFHPGLPFVPSLIWGPLESRWCFPVSIFVLSISK